METGLPSTFSCDSSFSGFGAVCGPDWLCGRWGETLSSSVDLHSHFTLEAAPLEVDNINVLELYPVYLSLLRWGPSWSNQRVVCRSDTQVVYAINKGRSFNEMSMALLRKIFWLTVICNCHLVASHIKGDENVLPDMLSRLTGAGDSDLPISMCCYRSTGSVRPTGCEGTGSPDARARRQLLEDQIVSMEILHSLL